LFCQWYFLLLFNLTKASVHDIHYLQDVKGQISDAYLPGDGAYLSEKVQIYLFSYANIKLNTPMQNNQHGYKKQPFLLRKARKRIETLFSQLCDQFMIRRNYAKSFDGFRTRILSKLSALTILQFINKFFNNKPVNHIKYALA
jgi:predicted lipase